MTSVHLPQKVYDDLRKLSARLGRPIDRLLVEGALLAIQKREQANLPPTPPKHL